MLNKKLHYGLLSLGAIALMIAFWIQYRIGVLREEIQKIEDYALEIGPNDPNYSKVLESAMSLIREQGSLDLLAKIFLGIGALVLIIGMILYYKKRKSKFYM